MNPVIERIYQSKCVEDAEGNSLPAFPVGVSYEEGMALYHLVRRTGARSTLETGLGYGLSSLFICQALQENGGGSHTAIDPFQTSRWKSIGLLNLRRAGLDGFVRFYEAASHQALPALARAGERFEVVFIDGNHRFDTALLDFFYADQLLDVGGHIMFDDLWMPSIRKVYSFVLRNRAYRPAPGFLWKRGPVWKQGVRVARSLAQSPLDFHAFFSLSAALARGFVDYVVVEKMALDNGAWNDHHPF